MQARTLPGTELTVSRACFGAMTFGSQTTPDDAARMVEICLEAGVNFFDTANVYNAGRSEEILGGILAGRRHSVIVATKVGMKVGDHPAGLTRDLILRAAEDSLRRLGTDYVDLFYLHTPDWQTPLEESLEAVNCLVRDGKVRYVASSNYASWQLARMLWIAEVRGFAPARVTQPMYNLIARRLEDEYLPACRDLGLATIAYNPLAGGLLTGKHEPAAPIAGTRFDGNRTYLDRYWNEASHAAVRRLAEAASSEGRSLVSLSLNWLLHHTPADCIVLGASRIEHLSANLKALADGPLSDATLARCDEVWNQLRGTAPKYNR